MYQPKLYLRFDPPIQNDSVGINQLDKILGLIENEYSSVYWFEGQFPSEFNPVTYLQRLSFFLELTNFHPNDSATSVNNSLLIPSNGCCSLECIELK